MSHPVVSIGMPVRNGGEFLNDAIESILSQTYSDLELVISDNASDDETEEIAHAWLKEDRRVRYHRQDVNLGAAPNHNLVFAQSRGELFKWAAHDDLLAPEFLSSCVSALRIQSHAVLAFANTTIVDERRDVTGYFDYTPVNSGRSPSLRLRGLLLADDPFFLHCFPIAGVIRASALRRTTLVGSFQSADKVLLVELALLGTFALVPERLFMRRWHAGTSRRAQTSPADIARWFDPCRSDSFPMPQTTVLRGYARGVSRTPMPLFERLRCYGVLGLWFLRARTWRVIGGEFRRAFRERRLARREEAP